MAGRWPDRVEEEADVMAAAAETTTVRSTRRGRLDQSRRQGGQGGRRFSFTALVVVGDGAGQVGVGYGKAREVPAAIQKGIEEAKNSFFRVPMVGQTITHAITGQDSGVWCC